MKIIDFIKNIKTGKCITIADLNLRSKLFLSYTIPIILILTAAGFLIFTVVNRSIQNSLENEMISSTESVRLMIENGLDLSIRNHLRGVSETNRDTVAGFYKQYKKGLLSEAEAKRRAGEVLLSQKIGKTGYIFAWDIRKAPHRVILAVHPFIQGSNVADVSFVQKGVGIKNGYLRYKWKNPGETAEFDKVMYLSYFEPWQWVIAVSSYRSEFTDLISISDFSEKLLPIRFGMNGYYFIIDSRGNVVIHPNMAGNFYEASDMDNKKFVKEICTRKNGIIEYYWPEPGETIPRRKLSIYRYISEFDWIIISSSYLDENNRTMTNLLWITLTSLALLIVLLSLSTYFSGSLIINPLKALMEKFRDGASGNYSLHLPVQSHDEFGEMAGHFNTFMEQIKVNRDGLISAQNYLHNIINSLPSILIAVDENGTITLWNRGAELFTGIPAEKAEKENLYIIFPMMETYRSSIEQAITGKTTIELRHKTTADSGGKKNLWISVSSFRQEEISIAVIRIDDVTDAVRKDEQLIQAQKMESVGNLAGGLAHDFNNVLAGIIGTVSLLQHFLNNGKSISDSGNYLSLIESSAKRAAEIVEQLLTLSKKSEPLLQPVDLNKSLENVFMICRNSLDKSIELSPSYLPEPAIIDGAPAQIEQILLNLCVNSAHAMTIMRKENETQGGTLTASVSKVTADRFLCSSHSDAVEGRVYIIVSISDNGVGISLEDKNNIFDPFFTTKSKNEGTGLGLSMVYNIVKIHGGFIDLYSEPGIGTTFNVYLPEGRGPLSDEAEDTATNDLPHGSGTILIIDDEKAVRETACSILEECGYTVHMAEDGIEGTAFFRSHSDSIDLVLLDMSMPRMSGKEVFIEIKKISLNTPVLLTSGFKHDQMVQETMKLGVEDYIQKPYSMKELAGKVNNMIKKP